LFFEDLQTLSSSIHYYIIRDAEKYSEKVWRFRRKAVILRMVFKIKIDRTNIDKKYKE